MIPISEDLSFIIGLTRHWFLYLKRVLKNKIYPSLKPELRAMNKY